MDQDTPCIPLGIKFLSGISNRDLPWQLPLADPDPRYLQFLLRFFRAVLTADGYRMAKPRAWFVHE